MKLLTFSTLFPHPGQPNHGVFVENRLRLLLASQPAISARVVAPVPWLPRGGKIFGSYADFGRAPEREKRGGLDIYHPRYLVIPKIGMALTPTTLFWASLPVLSRLKAESDFDLIDAHYFYPDGVAAIKLGTALNKPVVITARGTDVNLIPKYRLPRRMIQKAADQASGIITVSNALKEAIVALGIAPERVTVLRNGVDLSMFHPEGREQARKRLGLARPTLLSVGHLIERKGHHLVIDALKSLPDHELLIAGEGEERGALEAQIKRLNLENRVRLLGAQPHAALQSLYAAGDALVLASSREGWPNVLLEAMACGTPVIATPLWGNPEVVTAAAAGRLTRERSSAAIAEAIRMLFQEPPDRASTRHYAEQFSWDATSQGQATLFEKILSAAPASA